MKYAKKNVTMRLTEHPAIGPAGLRPAMTPGRAQAVAKKRVGLEVVSQKIVFEGSGKRSPEAKASDFSRNLAARLKPYSLRKPF
jgi:hypothetical protein